MPAHVWHTAIGALLEDDSASELDRIGTATLLTWGDADAFVPRTDPLRIRDAVKGSTLVIYEGAGHALHWEQPVRFAADVAQFARVLGGGLTERRMGNPERLAI